MDGTGNTDDTIKEESRCFVCDAEVQGRFYALATCRTQHSSTRIIEKLGELVGERYMVVITEDDVICRSCAILINHLDRLEMEMRNVRDNVLRFLEEKYSLKDGELRGDGDRPKPCQPPQITKSSTKDMVNYCDKQNKVHLETEERKNSIYLEDTKIQKNSNSWLQCDKCKYTTRRNFLMMYHLRDNAKQRKFCHKCRLYISENQRENARHNCSKTNESENKENKKDNSLMYHMRDYVKQREFCHKCGLYISENQRENTRHNCFKTNESENKENEKDNSDENDSMKTLLLENTLQSTLPLTQTTQSWIGSSNSDPLYISNILPDDPTSSKQSTSISQPVNVIDTYISRNIKRSSESNPVQEMEMKTKKQMLIDDGTVELVEVP